MIGTRILAQCATPTRGVVPAGPPVIITSPLLKVSMILRGTQYSEKNPPCWKHWILTVSHRKIYKDTIKHHASLRLRHLSAKISIGGWWTVFADQAPHPWGSCLLRILCSAKFRRHLLSPRSKTCCSRYPDSCYELQRDGSLRSRQGSSPAQICYFVILTMPRMSCVTFSLSGNCESKHGFISIYQ